MLKKTYLLVSIITIIFLTACSEKEIPNKKDWPIEDFSVTNQEGNAFTFNDDLKGKIWVADFIFTNCVDVCMPMTTNMAKLQNRLEDEKLDVELVSFSVDPVVDKPEVLKQFADNFHVSYDNWNFLTGYSQDYIESYARDTFKTIVQKPSGQDLVTHGIDFFLVDQQGKIVQYYSGTTDFPLDDLIEHIKILASK